MPAQRLVGNFKAMLDERALNFTGAVGDPTGVGDPTDGELLPAVLVASEGC
jgi:hypothetical protein